ncbi:MAG: asparagine synthase (glutamine-hydrolyzing) [Chloroflexota bacterium]|nr:asparagine synthase (glutamine-hydrolyzing) [Chloroflexota bacterium]
MCGIAGFFGMRERESARQMLSAMQAAMAHRGPDGQGIWIDAASRAGLAHVRLAVMDPTPAGAQPMTSHDGRYMVSFNGEIYNFREVRRELEDMGVGFQSGTDTEVLIEAFSRWGVDALPRLRGMFAFGIWDAQLGRGWLARDGFGIKPLYYAHIGDGLVFGSELRVMEAAGVPRMLDPSRVAGFFATGSVPEPGTLFQAVEVLPPGHVLAWDRDGSRTAPFWEVQFPVPLAMRSADAVVRARGALEDSVRAHFVSDVPVGLFLSGGIDSTALLALACRLGLAEQLTTFSVAVDDVGADESAVAARSARRFGARHHVLALDAKSAKESFPAFLEAMDVPSVDGFNTWTVSRFARQHGYKVVLSGLGGDELFAGYPSFRDVPRLLAAARMLERVPGSGALVRAVATRAPARWRRAADAVVRDVTPDIAHRAYRGIFPWPDAVRLAAHFCGVPADEVQDPLATQAPTKDGANAVSGLELTRYMRNQLLRDSDVMSMAHGLELRLPLVDQRLFDTIAAVPAAQRLKPGKGLLRAAVPELPAEVLNAPKRGFSFPVRKWLEEDFGGAFVEAGRGLPVSATEWYQKWSLVTFSHWRASRA